MAGEPTLEELEAVFGGSVQPMPEQQAGPSEEELRSAFRQAGDEQVRQEIQRQDEAGGWKPAIGSFVTGVGSTIPFAKDIAAGANVLRSELGGTPAGVPQQGTWGEKFTAAKESQERAQRVLGETHPGAQTAGLATGIGAQILAPGTRALAAGERAIAEMAGEAVPRAIAPATRGAVHLGAGTGLGAAYGYGEGVTPEERLENMKKGALLGAAGTALEPVVSTIGKGIGKGLGIVKPTPGVMTKDELFDAARNAYRESEQHGVMIKPDAIKDLHDEIISGLAEKGYHKKLTPELQVALDELNKLTMPSMQGAPNYTTLKGLDIVNQMARNASSSPSQQSRLMGNIFHNKVDEFLDRIGPNQVISGDAPEAARSLQNAQQYWKTARKTQKVEDLIDNAVLQTASTGSGGNINNKMKQAITNILVQNKKKPGGWTPDELAAMRAIIDPGAGRNLARLIGKLSPTGNGLHALLEIGAVSHNPNFLPLVAGGHLSKVYADRATAAAVDNLMELIRVGGNARNLPRYNPTGKIKGRNIGIVGAGAMASPWDREERSKGGKVYPAKRLTLLEKAARRAYNDISEESKPLMNMRDEHVAHALHLAKDK
jgi:hypothetical protein